MAAWTRSPNPRPRPQPAHRGRTGRGQRRSTRATKRSGKLNCTTLPAAYVNCCAGLARPLPARKMKYIQAITVGKKIANGRGSSVKSRGGRFGVAEVSDTTESPGFRAARATLAHMQRGYFP